MKTLWRWAALGVIAEVGSVAARAADDPVKIAEAFGAQPWVQSVDLSPDGKHVVFVSPGAGPMNTAVVEDVATGEMKTVTYADGKPLRITRCGWSANDRLVCELYGVSDLQDRKLGWNRIVAVDADGTKALAMGKPNRAMYYGPRTYDGRVVDWLSGADAQILMIRFRKDGVMGLERVDTRTAEGERVKAPDAGSYITDGNGTVRFTAEYNFNNQFNYTGKVTYRYQPGHDGDWQVFSRIDVDGKGLRPAVVDAQKNIVYAFQKLDGRDALYSVALDGSMKTELVFAHPQVDVSGVQTIGRHERPIGYSYITDQQHAVYFDPEYRTLAASLTKVLPKLPTIVFEGASADERKLLVFAASDVDAGHYYLFDRDTKHLTEVLRARPQLDTRKLAEQRPISYPAADGTMIPAYLTLPVGSTGKGLPAIVMPHGGPASRDVWGFDWLAQFFAARGYAVLQPQFRGSTGYGDAFLSESGFKSWRIAVGDVIDAGRWLTKQGIADPDRLGIFGWSYGGYAALQVNYLDPGLFKVVVAVAPVTDLQALRSDQRDHQNAVLVSKFVGSNANAAEGSPVRHADIFQAPVLMFHGDQDLNVDIRDSRQMDSALRAAGKSTRLVVYPGLDHQLDDSKVRADLLAQTDAFLAKTLKRGDSGNPGTAFPPDR
ncbi:MAG: alpha/beta fold hydrolase [Sphingomonas sp.]|uniref:S9 family peptidase n=1 Tax=Sphingomonas sp. TaxID=28214 RepID=UPI00356AA27E